MPGAQCNWLATFLNLHSLWITFASLQRKALERYVGDWEDASEDKVLAARAWGSKFGFSTLMEMLGGYNNLPVVTTLGRHIWGILDQDSLAKLIKSVSWVQTRDPASIYKGRAIEETTSCHPLTTTCMCIHVDVHQTTCAHTHAYMYIHMHAHTHKFILLGLMWIYTWQMALQALNFLELKCWIVKGKMGWGKSAPSGAGVTQKQTKCQVTERWSLRAAGEQEIFAIDTLSWVLFQQKMTSSKALSVSLRTSIVSKAEWDVIKFP